MRGIAGSLRKARGRDRSRVAHPTVRSMTSADGAMIGHRAATLLRSTVAAVPRTGVQEGLTTAELDAIERRFGFEFADDHRSFLATVLPIGPRWPHWRSGDDQEFRVGPGIGCGG